jgi:hypothetical protein
MVGPDGFEPSTPRLSSACSNQLSYEPGLKKARWGVVRQGRSSSGAKSFGGHPSPIGRMAVPSVAPEEQRMVEPAGFEPATPCLQSRCSAS